MANMTVEVALSNPYVTSDREAHLFTAHANAITRLYEEYDMAEAGVMASDSIESAMTNEWAYPIPVKDMLLTVASRGTKVALTRMGWYQD